MSGGSVQEKVKPVIQELKKNNKSGALFSVNLSKLVPIVRAVKLQYAEYLEENRISSELNSRSLVRSRGIAIVIDPQNQL